MRARVRRSDGAGEERTQRRVRRRERRKILRVYLPTRGRWSTEPPPRTGLPSVRRFWCVCQTCARLALARSSSRGPTCAAVPRGRFLRLPESIVGSIVTSLLSADQSAIGVYLIRWYRRTTVVPRESADDASKIG